MSGKAKDIAIHSQYGALTVLSRAGSRKTFNGACAQWLCSCNCGIIKAIDGVSLRAGRSQSCGQCPCRLRPYEALYNIFTSRATNKTNTVTYDDFVTYTNISDCHYCGGSVSWAMYSLGDIPTGHRYNLDRKNNTLGYHKDNLVVCCWPCNNAKGSLLSYEEMVAVGNIRRMRSKDEHHAERGTD